MRACCHRAGTMGALLASLTVAFAQPRPARDPAPLTDEQVIDEARDAAALFVNALPDYVAEQSIIRYYSVDMRMRWQILDRVAAELAYHAGNEEYRNIRVNGAPAQTMPQAGLSSSGEYSSLVANVLAPDSRTTFTRRGEARVASRSALVFDFKVEQPNSRWTLIALDQPGFHAAYEGRIWIDRETGRALRLKQHATAIPNSFPMGRAESSTEYAFVKIGERTFLMPTSSETLGCLQGPGGCMRNVITFRNYRKFEADSVLKYQ